MLADEGVMGLTRAFFYAGAQSLLVSLWNVNDAATASLMKRFYGNLKAGMPRDEARLRIPGSVGGEPLALSLSTLC
jgi:CHAT domain-containing protein